jgi:ribosome-binding ATPase YchF (GTP1/OBG family)
VVRCFEDPNVVHVDGRVNPLADIETIETELILKDLESVTKRLDKARKASRGGDANEKRMVTVCEALEAALDKGQPRQHRAVRLRGRRARLQGARAPHAQAHVLRVQREGRAAGQDGHSIRS